VGPNERTTLELFPVITPTPL